VLRKEPNNLSSSRSACHCNLNVYSPTFRNRTNGISSLINDSCAQIAGNSLRDSEPTCDRTLPRARKAFHAVASKMNVARNCFAATGWAVHFRSESSTHIDGMKFDA
jgi:hypothetical protein